MKVRTNPPIHLTYCLNIHPGETWEENFAAIRDHAVRVRDRVAPGTPFGLGLRLSESAGTELFAENDKLDAFRKYLNDAGMYVFTINGFPYGRFHGTAVKADVYAPDWRSEDRQMYTVGLAHILARLLPEGVTGSISTVPVAYRPWITGEADLRAAAAMLAETLMALRGFERQTGRLIRLALEPEPDCFIETTDQAIAALSGQLREFALQHLDRRCRLPADATGEAWDRHIGVCLDTAHATVEFEDPAESVAKLRAAGVPLAKVQLSSALRVKPTAEGLDRLEAFVDAVYLHQVKARTAEGTIVSFPDLPEALAAARADTGRFEELRVHFHVPLFYEGDEAFGSTSSLLTRELIDSAAAGGCDHFEIETYTFNVLPAHLRLPDVADSIAREYEWVMGRLI